MPITPAGWEAAIPHGCCWSATTAVLEIEVHKAVVIGIFRKCLQPFGSDKKFPLRIYGKIQFNTVKEFFIDKLMRLFKLPYREAVARSSFL